MLTRNPYFETQYYFYDEAKNDCKIVKCFQEVARYPYNNHKFVSSFSNTNPSKTLQKVLIKTYDGTC